MDRPREIAPARAGRGTGPWWAGAARRAWHRAAGITPGGRRPTGRFLLARMVLLPVLALTLLALASVAYFTLHGRTEQLRDRYTPALAELTHSRVALTLARYEAERRLGAGDGGPLRQTDLVGLGERYPSLLTEASQSLNNAAQTGALRRSQEQELRVVSGLVVSYNDLIILAGTRQERDGLRKAGLAYAADLLGDGRGPDGSTAVLDRIRALERELRADAARLSGWHPLTAAAAAGAALTALVFAVAVAGTLDFLRGRIRLHSPLLTVCATPVLLVLAMLVFGVVGQHRAQRYAGETVGALAEVSADRGRSTGIKVEIDRGLAAERDIEDAREELAGRLERALPPAWTRLSALALVPGTVGALGCGFTLFLYNRRHLTILWRTL
ncbi:hypothetical protein [Streptomyces yaizuensis]|uniref:Integral membrane protein n=1 Tax=Streptomyces yaizuensis TaxID=2989713 RepID=A0ABQ5NSS1_9ACTN|nr:hypothetical protein [Streptomyces sp. YSPA8]GLF93200.1 hypothetical protein SYYSPA8_02905 [Streptomyces sp. YSPA8]